MRSSYLKKVAGPSLLKLEFYHVLPCKGCLSPVPPSCLNTTKGYDCIVIGPAELQFGPMWWCWVAPTLPLPGELFPQRLSQNLRGTSYKESFGSCVSKGVWFCSARTNPLRAQLGLLHAQSFMLDHSALHWHFGYFLIHSLNWWVSPFSCHFPSCSNRNCSCSGVHFVFSFPIRNTKGKEEGLLSLDCLVVDPQNNPPNNLLSWRTRCLPACLCRAFRA